MAVYQQPTYVFSPSATCPDKAIELPALAAYAYVFKLLSRTSTLFIDCDTPVVPIKSVSAIYRDNA